MALAEERVVHNQKGIITRIELTNFMAYDEIEFYPGSFLNILIGPNGTGKSSIVCAIVLGLGGKPKIIGRTAQLKDYVNSSGGQKAKIVIELFNPDGENYVVQREFNKENKSTWHLNRKSVSQKEVDDLMKVLNIQVDNLCQFLPQDKVQDFTKMNVQQLLQNTVKTVGSTDMMDWHSSLVDMRKNEEEVQRILAAKTIDLEREKHKLSGLESEANFMRGRNKFIQRLELMKQKKAWTVFSAASDDVKEIIKEREELNKIKCDAEKKIKPYELEVKRAKDALYLTEAELNEKMRKVGSSVNAANKKVSEYDRHEENIARINRELQTALKNLKSKEEEINKLVHNISVIESTLPDSNKENELETEVSQLQMKINAQNSEIYSLTTTEDNLKHELNAVEHSRHRVEMRLNSANSLAEKKYESFKRRNPDAYELMTWLKENQDKFQGRVYDPIELEIHVKPEFARYVEYAIPARDLEAFVCELNQDVSTLLRVGRIEKKLGLINVISAEDCINFKCNPAINIKNLSAYGFQSYVMDHIEGPPAVLNYLSKTYNLHNIPIGSSSTESMLESIPKSITNFFTGENHHSARISKYSGAKVSRVTAVKSQPRVFVNSVDTELVRELKNMQELQLKQFNKVQNDLQKTRLKLEVAEQAREKLKNQKKDVATKLNELRTARTSLRMKKEELQILRASRENPDSLTKRAKQQTAAIVVQTVALQKSIHETILDYQHIQFKCMSCQLKQKFLHELLKRKEGKLSEQSEQLEVAKKDLENKQKELASAQTDAKKAFDEACQATGGLTPKDKVFKEKYLKKFNELPELVEELQSSIERMKAKIACMGSGRHMAIEEYENQLKKVETLESELANPQLNLNLLKEKMDAIKVKWMKSVMSLIRQINAKFSSFFERMGCVGEVDLYKPPIEENYQDYGIVIKVKFRNNDRLKELGTCLQSGGERAVATAVYMLALQHLTTVPFRCVDEINQGMDEKNERMVYTLLMHTVEETSAAQCFLLTPKLLFGLEYSDKTAVTCVVRGKVMPYSSFNFEAFVQERRRPNRFSRKRKHSDEDSS